MSKRKRIGKIKKTKRALMGRPKKKRTPKRKTFYEAVKF